MAPESIASQSVTGNHPVDENAVPFAEIGDGCGIESSGYIGLQEIGLIQQVKYMSDVTGITGVVEALKRPDRCFGMLLCFPMECRTGAFARSDGIELSATEWPVFVNSAPVSSGQKRAGGQLSSRFRFSVHDDFFTDGFDLTGRHGEKGIPDGKTFKGGDIHVSRMGATESASCTADRMLFILLDLFFELVVNIDEGFSSFQNAHCGSSSFQRCNVVQRLTYVPGEYNSIVHSESIAASIRRTGICISRASPMSMLPVTWAESGNSAAQKEVLRRISETLFSAFAGAFVKPDGRGVPSAVLLLLAPGGEDGIPGPCLILNKRSQRVRQPGDICCPGGGVARLDALLAKLLLAPGVSLVGGPVWASWRQRRSEAAKRLARILATGLRESMEEMRLNPFGVNFLGPLAPERLRMFRRIIHPMVCWVPRQTRFHPNWEVERIIRLPLRDLMNSTGYARFRLRYSPRMAEALGKDLEEFPCFLFTTPQGAEERLWGATYRIISGFLKQIFDFIPPPLERRPAVPGQLRTVYLTGTDRRR